MSKISFRDLRADEIELRAARVTEKGVQLLLYKDARVDMRILDETVGSENWQKRFYEHKNTLFCSVGINITGQVSGLNMGDGRMTTTGPEWVWKDDAGAPSNTEAEKGEASDAFKRACTNWGIGRELYTSPFVWVDTGLCNIRPGRNGKPACYDHFRVEKLRTEGGFITGLSIWNDSKKCRAFTYVDDSRHVEN